MKRSTVGCCFLILEVLFECYRVIIVCAAWSTRTVIIAHGKQAWCLPEIARALSRLWENMQWRKAETLVVRFSITLSVAVFFYEAIWDSLFFSLVSERPREMFRHSSCYGEMCRRSYEGSVNMCMWERYSKGVRFLCDPTGAPCKGQLTLACSKLRVEAIMISMTKSNSLNTLLFKILHHLACL